LKRPCTHPQLARELEAFPLNDPLGFDDYETHAVGVIHDDRARGDVLPGEAPQDGDLRGSEVEFDAGGRRSHTSLEAKNIPVQSLTFSASPAAQAHGSVIDITVLAGC
jgi:hypothetical protein